MTSPVLIMVAPNGARRTKADHENLPVTNAEIARCAAECFESGAGAIHAHVRDRDGRHILDADAYKDLLTAIDRECGPDSAVQITTEAVGRYTPEDQRAIVRAVRPRAVSVALNEMIPQGRPDRQTTEFYAWCETEGIGVQHILYDMADLDRLIALRRAGDLPGNPAAILIVLGRYTGNQRSDPSDLLPFATRLSKPDAADLVPMVCAFGPGERSALVTALGLGFHVRTGFENSIVAPDGTPLASNTQSVVALDRAAELLTRPRLRGETALAVLGVGQKTSRA